MPNKGIVNMGHKMTIRDENVRVFARLYLPYCMFGKRSEARNGLIVDAAVWGGVLAAIAAQFVLAHF
jgi:hypothetical protein